MAEMTRKVVYHPWFGGFGLSIKAVERLAELGVEAAQEFLDERAKHMTKHSDGAYRQWLWPDQDKLPRHDPRLIQVFEELGAEAGENLVMVEVDGPYRIDEYDGNESVETPGSYEWK